MLYVIYRNYELKEQLTILKLKLHVTKSYLCFTIRSIMITLSFRNRFATAVNVQSGQNGSAKHNRKSSKIVPGDRIAEDASR